MAGKVAFPLPDDNPLGGVITIEIGGENLGDWLEAATWHSGRRTSLGELVMNLLWMLTVKQPGTDGSSDITVRT